MTLAPEPRPKDIVAVTHGEATSDGDGVKMTRLIGARAQAPLDPFLMLDFFGSDEASDTLGGESSHARSIAGANSRVTPPRRGLA